MTIFELKGDRIETVERTTFREQGLKERGDLQRLLQERIEIVDADLKVLAEEFGRWDESKRRIDLLAIDKDARLVVVELKRTEDGGHMELQALRYAAMVSRMTFEQAVEAHERWLQARGKRSDAEGAILEWLGWDEPDEEQFGQDVRIVLVAADFSKELTTSVLWLNERDLDVRCVRMRPYVNDGRVLVDVQQVIPLPEAQDYVVQVREKGRRERQARASGRDYTRYDVIAAGRTHEDLPKRRAIHRVVKTLCDRGATPQEITEVLDRKENRLWRSAEGEIDAGAFEERMEAAAAGGGLVWDSKRWHLADGELIHSSGRTWALTNQWGGKTREAMARLTEHWPQAGIEVRQSTG